MPANDSSGSADYQVRHEPEQSRYSARVDGALAVAEYQRRGNTIAFTHTEVPPEIEGRGVASAIARRALDDARAEGSRVLPRCAFFAKYMEDHPEYNDLLAGSPAG